MLDTFNNPETAFEYAIDCGTLSANTKAHNYAGNYMYMGWDSAKKAECFKHRITRQYVFNYGERA